MSFDEAAEDAALRLKSAGRVTVVSHIDADGLCSAAIASRGLTAAGVDHEVRFVKSLGSEEVGQLLEEAPETCWFVDLGSGQADNFVDKDWVIADHHTVKGRGPKHHVNPHLHGIDGSREISGAGTTWALVRHLVDADLECELAALAVIGAVGDLQHRDGRGLQGANRAIVGVAAEGGHIEPVRDVTWFGRESRPLHKFFQYADEPAIPGVSGSSTGAIQFLAEEKVSRRGPDGDRCWVHLEHHERQRLCSAVARRILASGRGGSAVRSMFGEVYELANEVPGTPLHDAKEFATLLNSTARYGRHDVGLALAMGDRGAALEEAGELAAGHRRALVEAVDFVVRQGLERQGHLQYFHGGDRIRDTIVGIVAGMVQRRSLAAEDAVMVAFANSDAGSVKVSCRLPRKLAARGANLAEGVAEAARSVGGEGGGHIGAAGATIPAGMEVDFLAHLDTAVDRQIGRRD